MSKNAEQGDVAACERLFHSTGREDVVSARSRRSRQLKSREYTVVLTKSDRLTGSSKARPSAICLSSLSSPKKRIPSGEATSVVITKHANRVYFSFACPECSAQNQPPSCATDLVIRNVGILVLEWM